MAHIPIKGRTAAAPAARHPRAASTFRTAVAASCGVGTGQAKRGKDDPLEFHIAYGDADHTTSTLSLRVTSVHNSVVSAGDVGLHYCRPGGGGNIELQWCPETHTAKMALKIRVRRIVQVHASARVLTDISATAAAQCCRFLATEQRR